jgi:signal transduction histidine kinase
MNRRLRLLIIDDNPDDRKLALRMLGRHFPGLEAVEVNDERSLGDAIASPPYDAVITDYSLGWTNGIAVLEELQRQYPNLPVIMFTMTGSEEICAEAMKKGLFDYILKKVEYYARLPVAVRSAVDFAEMKAALAARERELRERSEQLAAENRRKDEFLAMLAHELRNPLAAINNAVQLLGEADGEEEHRWAKDVVRRQVEHLGHMLSDLLDLSRLTRGRLTLKREPVEFGSVVGVALELVRPLMEERGHELALSVAPGPVLLDADRVRLEQVLVNLLTNAAKYTEPGGRIELTTRCVADDVEISVRDNGTGIAPDLLPHIFDPLAQGERSLARSEGGLGIGLTIVKRLVELHGGTVSATSGGPGHGSEFTVTFPAVRQAEPSREEAPAGAPESGRPARVLVVDDNIDLARSLARYLKRLGHDVQTAYEGNEAIERARSHRPEFLLLDIGLPGRDGYQVAEELRRDASCKRATFIAITGYGREEDRRRSREAGFDHHLVKPVDFNVLLMLLGKG